MPMRGHVPERAAGFGRGAGVVEADIPERLRIEPREVAALAMERKKVAKRGRGAPGMHCG